MRRQFSCSLIPHSLKRLAKKSRSQHEEKRLPQRVTSLLSTPPPLPLPLPCSFPSVHSQSFKHLPNPAGGFFFLAPPSRSSLCLSLPSLSSLRTCSFFSSVLFLAICAFVFVFVGLRCVVGFVLLGDFGMALTCRTPFTLHSNSEKFYSIRILKFSICCCCFACFFGCGARILRSKNLSNSSLWVIVSVIVFCLLSSSPSSSSAFFSHRLKKPECLMNVNAALVWPISSQLALSNWPKP